MAAGGASFLAAVVVFSMLIMSSLGNPRPLCSDCGTLCSTKCNEEANTRCSSNCYNPQEECQRQVSEECIRDGTCCSSYGTCTCDCNTIAQERCSNLTDNYTDCQACTNSIFNQCNTPCNNDCNNNCKKKGCNNA
ncbi:hypothetical protein CFC21_045198 [Triticum aestivum]|uniref:Uncharacterized protein n=2 Tax=Triticum aestivum TaxID=4565 RepID=A0A3B6GN49_WHEAT|nr:hypothetical protein CFC21_045198 [Triticum aestivum]